MSNHQDTTGIGASSASGWQRKKTWALLFLATVALLIFGFLLEVFIYTTYKGTTGNILEEKWKILAGTPAFGALWAFIVIYLHRRWRKNSIRYSYWIALILGFLSYLIFTLTISSVELILSILNLENFDRTNPYDHIHAFFECIFLYTLIALHNLINFFISIPLAFKLFWSSDKSYPQTS
ncbi:hypothetical protein [Azotobacter vinelandii]|uniref:hypothetical protein n=1 Tax=Azotobacter vinelandii TaxID=354 RepID=UPI0026658254|nr:hypothetical protein [Azotobacter vinelandii]WKN21799.1 hypothetical protein AVAEIV_004915 [Azotobacter vinelandii]